MFDITEITNIVVITTVLTSLLSFTTYSVTVKNGSIFKPYRLSGHQSYENVNTKIQKLSLH